MTPGKDTQPASILYSVVPPRSNEEYSPPDILYLHECRRRCLVGNRLIKLTEAFRGGCNNLFRIKLVSR